MDPRMLANGLPKIEEEIEPKSKGGMAFLLWNTLLCLVSLAAFVYGCVIVERSLALGLVLILVGAVYAFVVGPLLYCGLKVIKPNEAMVLTLFGKYYGTLRREGFYYVNPFVSAVAPPAIAASPIPAEQALQVSTNTTAKPGTEQVVKVIRPGRKISLKAMTLDNGRQKINDQLGNPIIIGIVVIWRVTNTVKAVFNVDNFADFLSIQCDSALRNIVRLYPYDSNGDEDANEKSLRGSSMEIAAKLKEEIQVKVDVAGLEIMEARITHLAYAPEIAAAMLQRQQASAIVDARQLIVEGAVGMVEMALERLSEREVVHLDEERKATMVSNLLVVLCGNKDAQPVVNSGSLY